MTLFDNLIAVFVLLCLALIVYLRVTNRTLLEFYRDVRGIMDESQEEVIRYE